MKKLLIGVCAAVAAAAVANAALVNHWSFDDTEHPFRDSVTGTDGVVVKCTSKGNYEEADATTVAATLKLSDEKAYDGLKENSGAIDLMQYVGFKALHGIDKSTKSSWCAVIRFFNETTSGYRAIYSIDPPAGWGDGHLFLNNGGIGVGSYTQADVTEQKWYTLIISFDVAGNAKKFFVNGSTRGLQATGSEDLTGKSCFIFGLDNWGEDKSLYWDDIKIYDEAYPEEYFISDGQGGVSLRVKSTESDFDVARAASSVLPTCEETESGADIAFADDGTLTLKGKYAVVRKDFDALGALMGKTDLGTLETGTAVDAVLGKAAKSVYSLTRTGGDGPASSGEVKEVGAAFAKFRCSLNFLGVGGESADLYLGIGAKGGELSYELVGEGYTGVAETDFTLTGLSPETEYDYTVKAVNNAGETGETERRSFATEAAPASGGIAFSVGEASFSFSGTTPTVSIPCDVSYAGTGADFVKVTLRYGRAADDLSESLTLAEGVIGRNVFAAECFEPHQTYFGRVVCDNGIAQSSGEVIVIKTWPRWTRVDEKTITDGDWVFLTSEQGREITLSAVSSETKAGLKVCDLSSPVTDGDGNEWSIVQLGVSLFKDNMAIEEVYLPEATLRSIGGSVFSGCKNLRVVNPFLPDSVTSVGDHAFRYTWLLGGDLRLGFGGQDVALGRNCFDVDWDSHNGRITTITIGPGVKSLPYAAFWGQSELTNVTFVGDSITAIERIVFAHCAKLESVTPFLPASLEQINFPDEASGENGAFFWCRALAGDLVLGGGTNELKVGKDAFKTSAGNPLTAVRSILIRKNVTEIGANALARLDAATVRFEARPDFVKGVDGGTFGGCREYARYYVSYRHWKDIVDDPAYVTPWAQVDQEERAKFAEDYPGEKHPYGLTTAALFGQKEWLFVDRPGLVLIVR